MDLMASSTVFAPSRLGLEYILAPTAKPTCHQRTRGLYNRQNTGSVSLATCGFIGGDADSPVTCGTDYYCATTSTYVGCCEAANCVGVFTTCYDLLGNSCDAVCQNNPENLVCPGSLPYCAIYQYEGGSTGFGCALNRGFTTTVLLTPKDTLGTISTPTPTSNSTTTTPTANTSPTPTPEPSSSGLGGGAIAGIVIGAVAVLALLAFMFWFVRRRKQKNPEINNTTSTSPYTSVPREDTAVPMRTRSEVTSTAYSDSTTAYALPSPRTDPWKQSWQTYSEADASYAASNGYSNPRSPTGAPDGPMEMPGPHSQTFPSELDASERRRF